MAEGVHLPPKEPGVHRWIVLVQHTVTAGQADALAGGWDVPLGPHNRVGVDVGCVDCEGEWGHAVDPCPADAAPELDDVTAPPSGALSEEDRDRLTAAIDVVGRAGARGFELGFLDADRPAHLARWYATATYRGAKVIVEEHASPVDAAEELAWRLVEGGRCTSCGGRVAVDGHGIPDLNGVRCRWSRRGDCWVPGCVPAGEVEGYVAERRAKHVQMRTRSGP